MPGRKYTTPEEVYEAKLAAARRYYYAHREEIRAKAVDKREYYREYYRQHKSKIQSIKQKYYTLHREVILAKARTRYAAKKQRQGAPGDGQ